MNSRLKKVLSLVTPALAFALAACAGAPCPTTDTVPAANASDVPAGTQGSAPADQQAGAASQEGAGINGEGGAQALAGTSGAENATAVNAQAGAGVNGAGTGNVQGAGMNGAGSADPAGSENAGAFQSQALDSYRLSTPGTSPGSTGEIAPAGEAPESQRAEPVDPYVAFPALAARIFAHADSLYTAGLTDSASAYLQRFRIIKPLWTTWEAQTDSMLNEFGKTRAEKAKAFDPLVLTIQNMNRVKAAYSMVAEIADSLVALAPGDSLVNWAISQKQNAFANTLEKAKNEFGKIKALADDQAQFAEALKKAEEFRMRYSDFAETLRIQEYIDHIKEMMLATNADAVKYWESHDPAQALARADSLIKSSKFTAARDLLNKLKASQLRKEANAKYAELASTFCNAQRKLTSQIFAKAQKQKKAEKRKKLLQDAIAPLEKCLAEYPENPQKQKVLDNKRFLENELAK